MNVDFRGDEVTYEKVVRIEKRKNHIKGIEYAEVDRLPYTSSSRCTIEVGY